MPNRHSKKLVSFQRPFTLNCLEDELPAGDYLVEIEEEPIRAPRTGYRTISTVITKSPGLPPPASARRVEVNALEFEVAMLRDRDKQKSII